MTTHSVERYFRRPIGILGFEKPAYQWMLFSVGSAILLGGVVYAYSLLGLLADLPERAPFIAIGLVFIALFLILLRALFATLRQFVAFSLVLAAASFATNALLLNHAVFPPFTNRTVWALWLTFGALAAGQAGGVLPPSVRWLLQPLLTLGFFLCIAFVLVLAPVMAFSWILVWFAGLGFLPYSPLCALIAFGATAHSVHTSLSGRARIWSLAAVLVTSACVLAYGAYFRVQWNRAEVVLAKTDIGQGHNMLDGDLPVWVRRAARLPVNHVTEMVLQPNRTSVESLFALQALFDPAAYLTAWMSRGFTLGDTRQTTGDAEAGRMLHLLFQKPHAEMQRLWQGHSLITTDLATHVQLHPELRISYTETTLSIFNENSSSNRSWILGRGTSAFGPAEEAIYTFKLPDGSVCTKLSLWIDGQEQPARLTFRSTARTAYRTIVGREKRDPSYMEWLDGNRLRLRVFPVAAQGYRTVRFGIISPLRDDGDHLTYVPLTIEDGPVTTYAERRTLVDFFSKSGSPTGHGITLGEKVVPDGQVRQFVGAGGAAWEIQTTRRPAAGTVSAGGLTFSVQDLVTETQPFHADGVYVALNGSLPRKTWKEIVGGLYRRHSNVHILSNEWFHSAKLEKAIAYLDQVRIPSFNLFPLMLPQEHGRRAPLWVLSGEAQSIPLGELRESERFSRIQSAMAKGSGPARAILLNGRLSEYAASLVDLDQMEIVGTGQEALWKVLDSGQVQVLPRTGPATALPYAGLRLVPQRNTETAGKPGSDLVVRLFFQRRIMQSLGRRFFNRDLENGDLVTLARRGMIVSPVSTLIVLESEKDYRRFGIGGASLLGQSKLEAPGAAPEPHEIALLIVALLALLIYFRTRRASWESV